MHHDVREIDYKDFDEIIINNLVLNILKYLPLKYRKNNVLVVLFLYENTASN